MADLQIDTLAEDDILIRPELGTFGSSNFGAIQETVGPGQQAARERLDRLARLALDESAWDTYMASRVLPPAPASHLAFVRVVHDLSLIHI